MQDPAALERRRKLFTFLPVIVLPCLTLLFWGLGGGSSAAPAAGDPAAVSHVNTTFPEPILEKEDSKLAAYELSEAEASRRRRSLERDPYADQLRGGDTLAPAEDDPAGGGAWERRYAERTADLESKLQRFDQRLSAPGATAPESGDLPRGTGGIDARKLSSGGTRTAPFAGTGGDRGRNGLTEMAAEEAVRVAQLEATVAQLNAYGAGNSENGEDLFTPPPGAGGVPLSAEDNLASVQLERLDKIMERATLLQYPELAERQLRERSAEDGEHVYAIADRTASERAVHYFGAASADGDSLAPPRVRGGFYSDRAADNFEQVTVAAQVHSDVTVLDGSTVKLRLLEDVYLAGQRIPTHSFVYASTSLRGDRLLLRVKSINFRGNLYEVSLAGYDLDGQEGIGVPGAIERDIAKREAAQATRGLGGATAAAGGRNLATQLAAEGSETIREIAARKLAAVKIDLKAGHRIILHNE